jgi:anti-sigma B factor antagonist
MSDSNGYQVRVVDSEGECIVEVSGEIDLHARAELVTAIGQASTAGQRLAIDLSGTTFIDSTTLKALLDTWRARVSAGHEFVLRDPSPAVMRILSCTSLADALPVERTDHS